jgi:hypothetical protein
VGAEFLSLSATGDRRRLDAVLRADSERERARAVRKLLVGALAVLGVPLWVLAVWPGLASGPVRSLELTAFAFALAGLTGALVWEWACGRRRAWRIAEMAPPPVCSKGVRGACARGPEEES